MSYAKLGGGRKPVSYSIPFENIVQSTARDIVAYQLLEAERQGFDLRFHTHDEAVFQVPEADAFHGISEIERIFKMVQPEFQELPVSCEAHLSDRYTKDENHMKAFAESLRRNKGEKHD